MVRMEGEITDSLEIGAAVQWGYLKSPLLFILLMEEATKESKVRGLWELLYADEFVLTAEAMVGVEFGPCGSCCMQMISS